MEKSETIRCFNQGKHYIETCLEQIASLEQNNDKELRQVLRGTVMVEVSYKAAENFCKVGSYVIDGKDGAQKLKDKLINMKVKVLQLYDGADRNNLLMIKNICDTIISEINEVEEWTGDNEQTNQETGLTVNNPIPETGESGNESIGEKPLTKEDIIKSLKEIEPYKPLKDDESINYKEYYKRLTEGGVIDKKWPLDLFQYCVERADISKIVVKAEKKRDGKKGYARLFMNDVASKFSDSAKYRKKAAESFGLENSNIGAVGGDAKLEYQRMMKGLFVTNHQRKRP